MRSRHYSETIQFGDFHFRLDRKHTYPDSFQKAKNWFDGKSKFSPFHCRKGRSSLFLFAFFFFKVCLPLIKCIPYIHSVKKRENHSHWKIFHEINSLVNQLLFTIFFPKSVRVNFRNFNTVSYLLYSLFFSALAEGTILDNHQLICLFMLSQLLERELNKCLRLVVAIPMDMTSFYGM